MGRHDEALRVYERARGMAADSPRGFPRTARVYALMGRQQDARRMLADLGPVGAPAVHAALGQVEKVFASLFEGLDRRDEWLLFIKSDPDFDGLHADARRHELLRRMNLQDR